MKMNEEIKSHDDDYPLLLTGTIIIDTNNASAGSIDLEKRIGDYERSLQRYICDTKFNPIVFIDNSGYPLDVNKYEQMASEHGKAFEFLKGTECKAEVEKHGKGYGDALLVEEALAQSKLLANEAFFYKITGRIFLTNSDGIIKSCSRHRNEFISYDGMGWVLTYLFKANIADYKNVMKGVYLQCDDKSRRDMEICFWLRLYGVNNLDIGSFETYPVIEGTMGTSSIPYTKSKVDTFLRTIGIKLGIFTMKSISSKIFWNSYRKITGRKPYVDESDCIGDIFEKDR